MLPSKIGVLIVAILLITAQFVKVPTQYKVLTQATTELRGGCIQVEADRLPFLGQRLCADDNGTLRAMLYKYVEEQQTKGNQRQLAIKAQRLAKAISIHETGERNIPGQTGELATKYQFMPNTWKSLAKQYLGNASAKPTTENQDKVATAHITQMLKEGYTEQEIAMIWNGGKPYPRKGTTKTTSGKVIKYDTKLYAIKVLAIYNTL